MKEIELKFLDINKDEIIKKLVEVGAVQKYETELETTTFEGPNISRMDSAKTFLRVRKVVDDVILTVKAPAEDSVMAVREEYEVKVDDYKEAVRIFEQLGFVPFSFSKKRTHFELDTIHFEIDEWGFIPPFLEVETQTEEQMQDIVQKLGLRIEDGKKGMITEIFPEKFRT